MHAQACRTASGAGVCDAALLGPAVLASVLLDASRPRAQRSRQGLTIQAKAKNVVHCDGKNSSQSIRIDGARQDECWCQQ